MNILSIETSADETSVAFLVAKETKKSTTFLVRAHETSSQVALHATYGGIFPNLAKREHAQALIPLLTLVLKKSKIYKEFKNPKAVNKKKLEKILEREHSLKETLPTFLEKITPPKIDLITVTTGPGLEPALWVGINFAQALSFAWGVPVYGVNHMEGHIASSFSSGKKTFTLPHIQFPVLSLLISGGHTELVLVTDIGKYKILGQTRDDAVGEAFDKVARTLSLPYPGGPEISRLALQAREKNTPQLYTLPRPMIGTKDFDFSFSGLKTAVLYTVRDKKIKTETDKEALAREFENACTEVLIAKTRKALQKYAISTLVIGGGVSANRYLQTQFNIDAKKNKYKILWPGKGLTGDNALMIALAGFLRYTRNKKPRPLKANGNLEY